MDFKNIIGHEDIISRFMSSIELNRVNHAYIIAGEEGSVRLVALRHVGNVSPVSRLRVVITLT